MLRNFLRLQARLALPVHARLSTPLRRQLPKFFLPSATRSTQSMANPTLSEILEPLREQGSETATKNEAETSTKGEPTVPSRSLFVSNIPYSVEETELREIFASYGTITNVRIACTSGGRRIGYAHVEFASREEALHVFESGAEEPFVLFNRQLRIEMASKTKSNAPERSLGEPSQTIHIANNPRPGDERAIRDVFRQFEDKITRINFMRDIDGNYTSKAFVKFVDAETAANAITLLQKAPLDGTYLNLYYARDSRNERRQK